MPNNRLTAFALYQYSHWWISFSVVALVCVIAIFKSVSKLELVDSGVTETDQSTLVETATNSQPERPNAESVKSAIAIVETTIKGSSESIMVPAPDSKFDGKLPGSPKQNSQEKNFSGGKYLFTFFVTPEIQSPRSKTFLERVNREFGLFTSGNTQFAFDGQRLIPYSHESELTVPNGPSPQAALTNYLNLVASLRDSGQLSDVSVVVVWHTSENLNAIEWASSSGEKPQDVFLFWIGPFAESSGSSSLTEFLGGPGHLLTLSEIELETIFEYLASWSE
jgi:hypothetical protein